MGQSGSDQGFTGAMEREWPSSNHWLARGSIVLIGALLDQQNTPLLRQPIQVFHGPCMVPGIATTPGGNIQLSLRLMTASTKLEPIPPNSSKSESAHHPEINLEQIKAQLIKCHERDQATMPNAGLVELDLDLMNTLESAGRASAQSQTQQADQTIQVVDWALKGIESSLRFKARDHNKDLDEQLEELLSKNGIIYRRIKLKPDDIKAGCGSIIAISSDEQAHLIALRPSPSGYELYGEKGQAIKISTRQAAELWAGFNPYAYSIQPALKQGDLTTLGLMQFSFGKPQGLWSFILAGTLIGGIAGFITALTSNSETLRWVFGIAISGGLLGASLGMLSQGFRSALALTLMTTGIGLLTPTFNTILTNEALPYRDFSLLMQVAGILIVTGLVEIAVGWSQGRILQETQHKGSIKMQFASIHRLLLLPVSFFNRYTYGDLQTRIGGLDSLRDGIKELLEGGLLKVALTSLYILFMLKISVKLTALTILITLAVIIPTAVLGIKLNPYIRKSEELSGETMGRNLELIGSVSKLRSAGAERRGARYWAQSYRRLINLEQATEGITALSSLLQELAPSLNTLLIFIVISQLAQSQLSGSNDGAPNIGELLGFFSASSAYMGGAMSLAGLIVSAYELPVIYKRVRPILEAVPESQDNAQDPGLLQGDVTMQGVSYRYAPELDLTLKNISLTIKAGSFTAIVGPSGGGKSTIAKLLLGFDTPEDGNIYFDGHNLRNTNLKLIRQQIGTVLQSSGILSGSLFEAIAGGRVVSLEEAWEVAEQVGLADDIRQLPMGMQTVLPEGGGTLSGGQRQRVAIARALINNPRLLLFDEATSALDNRTQSIVSNSLEKLNITRIIIAHRLSTIEKADHVIVVDDGRIAEQGSFKDLLNSDGLFSKLMLMQIS